jgi:putative acetyltransferase
MTLPVFRWADASDYDALGRIMFEAVHTGPSPYTDAQRQAWIAAPYHGADWHNRLVAQDVILAQVDGEIVGFMSLAPNEYLDFAYLLYETRGQGIFRQMYNRIESCAVELGHSRIWVHASLLAAPAFDAMGFIRLKSERVERGAEYLDRFEMEKILS